MNRSAVFNLVWTYAIKEVDGQKKAQSTCDGSMRGGQVHVLDCTGTPSYWGAWFLGVRFFWICIEHILYLNYNSYRKNKRLLLVIPTLALLVLKTLEYSILLSHILEVDGERGVSKEQCLEKNFWWAAHKLLVGWDVFLCVLERLGNGNSACWCSVQTPDVVIGSWLRLQRWCTVGKNPEDLV